MDEKEVREIIASFPEAEQKEFNAEIERVGIDAFVADVDRGGKEVIEKVQKDILAEVRAASEKRMSTDELYDADAWSVENLGGVMDLNKPHPPYENSRQFYQDPNWKKDVWGNLIEFITLDAPRRPEEPIDRIMAYEAQHDNRYEDNLERSIQEAYEKSVTDLSDREILDRWSVVQNDNYKCLERKKEVVNMDIFNKEEKSEKALAGILVFHVNVGHLAPEATDALCAKMEEKYKATFDRVKASNWEVVVLPVRNSDSHFEQIILKGQ